MCKSKEESCNDYKVKEKSGIETIYDGKLLFRCELNNYYVLGLINQDLSSLLVTLMAEDQSTGRKERIKIDLYDHEHIRIFANQLSDQFCQDKIAIETELINLTNALEIYRENQNLAINLGNPLKRNFQPVPPNKEAQILKFLKSPDLISKLDNLIEKAGVVGEENTRKLLFIIASTYKTNFNLHCLIQGMSGSGKSHLINTIGQCMPPEDVISVTRITSKSLYHFTHDELINKLMLIQDFDGLNDEAQYAFRELQSSGSVSSSITYKDKTGNLSSTIKIVKSHFASLMVTTKSEIYFDNLSRCLVAGINESEDQTKRIIDYQNKKMTSNEAETNENTSKEFLQSCIRCLKNVEVINPYADKVNLPFEVKMSRRLNNHFHQFIKQITLLHQYQRKRDNMNRIITEPIDIRLACEILFDSIMIKVDDMDSSLRQFFEKLKNHIKKVNQDDQKNYEFSRREIRLALNLCKTACVNNLNKLLQLEYIEKTSGYANRGFKYMIIYYDNLAKLRSDIKQRLNEQLDFEKGLIIKGKNTPNGHQDSSGTRRKPLATINSKNTHSKGGEK